MNDCYEKKRDAVLSLRVQKNNNKKHLSINAYLLPSLFLVLWVFILCLYLPFWVPVWRGVDTEEWTDGSVHKHGGRQGLNVVFSGPCLWDCEQKRRVVFDPHRATLSSGPPESSGLASGFGSNSWLIPPAWMDRVAGIISRLPVGKLSLGATEWELPLVYEKRKNHTLQQESFKKKQTEKTPSQHLSSLQTTVLQVFHHPEQQKKKWRF